MTVVGEEARATAVTVASYASGRPGLGAEPLLDDRTLVVRAQEGDVGAFEVLARRHHVALYRVALRVSDDAGGAQDALQEALLSAWRQIDRFRGDVAFSTGTYRIVVDRSVAASRRRAPVPVPPTGAEGAALDPLGPRGELDAELAALGRAVADLPADLRVCWVLRALEGLGHAEIAEITGASEDAVHGRIHAARVQLAEETGTASADDLTARTDAARLDAVVRRMADEPVAPPPRAVEAVVRAVRAEPLAGETLLLEPWGAGDPTATAATTATAYPPNRLASVAAAAVLRAVVDAVDGLRARSCRVGQPGPGTACDVALTVTARFGLDLAGATARARQTVLAAGEQALGLPLRRVDIEVVDLWETS